ncbi:MBL fold metallo-hydrolase, partial [Xanthomonas campestris pv. nigromaculans]|nr:MBL fold metallo-hydrolase [Xanthomonas campestris pv. nigromaculans]
DCGVHGNPSHTGVDDLEREYPQDLLNRMLLYHYASDADGDVLRSRGHRVAVPGQYLTLANPTAATVP